MARHVPGDADRVAERALRSPLGDVRGESAVLEQSIGRVPCQPNGRGSATLDKGVGWAVPEDHPSMSTGCAVRSAQPVVPLGARRALSFHAAKCNAGNRCR